MTINSEISMELAVRMMADCGDRNPAGVGSIAVEGGALLVWDEDCRWRLATAEQVEALTIGLSALRAVLSDGI